MRMCVCVCCCVGARTRGFHDSILQQGDTGVCVFTCLWTHSLQLFSCTRRVCMSVFVYVFGCFCLYLYLCRCLRMHAVFHGSVLHSGVCECMRACVRECVCVRVCVRAFVCVCVRMSVCMYLCIFVCA